MDIENQAFQQLWIILLFGAFSLIFGKVIHTKYSKHWSYTVAHTFNCVCTAIPYRESTGFLQGIPCVVFPPLHALAVYRV